MIKNWRWGRPGGGGEGLGEVGKAWGRWGRPGEVGKAWEIEKLLHDQHVRSLILQDSVGRYLVPGLSWERG